MQKIKELEIDIVKTKYANNPNNLQSQLKKLNKIHLIDENLQEVKNGLLREHAGEFEFVGRIKFSEQISETHIRFRNIGDFESYIDQRY